MFSRKYIFKKNLNVMLLWKDCGALWMTWNYNYCMLYISCIYSVIGLNLSLEKKRSTPPFFLNPQFYLLSSKSSSESII